MTNNRLRRNPISLISEKQKAENRSMPTSRETDLEAVLSRGEIERIWTTIHVLNSITTLTI